VDAACNCGAPVISKAQRVADHFAANPGENRSDREIAADLGVGKNTVLRARKSPTGPHGPVDDDDRPTIDKPPRGELWDDQEEQESKTPVRSWPHRGFSRRTSHGATTFGGQLITLGSSVLCNFEHHVIISCGSSP
jgi:hypothetical protein